MGLGGIRNFIVIDDRLGTAGQPTEAQLVEVRDAGYAAVINLGILDPKYCLRDEAGSVAKLAMRYRHHPVIFDGPKPEDFATFLATMDEWAADRVFVHCAANYRVSAFMSLYGELRLGWKRAYADAHARRLWSPNEVWLRFLDECRARFL
jgi:protein tyrosine phosphatase (PTP) superfamily phosphohydrolase (DUF442 family)